VTEAPTSHKLTPLDELTFTYEDMRVAFAAGFASCQDGQDADDAWDEHREFLRITKRERKA